MYAGPAPPQASKHAKQRLYQVSVRRLSSVENGSPNSLTPRFPKRLESLPFSGSCRGPLTALYCHHGSSKSLTAHSFRIHQACLPLSPSPPHCFFQRHCQTDDSFFLLSASHPEPTPCLKWLQSWRPSRCRLKRLLRVDLPTSGDETFGGRRHTAPLSTRPVYKVEVSGRGGEIRV